MFLPLFLSLQTMAHADALRIEVEGMICVSCEMKIKQKLEPLGFLKNLNVSVTEGLACGELVGAPNNQAITKAITSLGYTITSIETASSCSLKERRFPVNWATTEGLDVQVISRGNTVDLAEHAATGKFTIYDFGAPWCGPCHVAEKMLKDYLRTHTNVAIRAVILDSDDAKTSFAMDVAKQHLMSAPGLPYFVVIDPQGRTVFKGTDVSRLLKKLDRKL